MEYKSDSDVARLLTRIAGAISFVIIVGVPLGYFWVTYSYETERLQHEADLLAESVSVFAYTNPDLWRYEEHRIKDLTLLRHIHGTQQSAQIIDADDGLVAEVGISPQSPTFSRASQIRDGTHVVGRAMVTGSLRPILYRTAAIIVFSLFIGTAIYLTLRLLPFRALERLMRKLADSNAALENEINAKETTLKKLRKLQYAIQHQALHDDLTKLANRTLFNDRLEQAILVADRENKTLAVFYLDLNRFKDINDIQGHDAGDQVLRMFSARLQKVLRESDTIARIGGDEFVLLLPLGADREAAIIATKRLEEAIQEPIVVAGQSYDISISVGIALFPEHGTDVAGLMHCADVAMYEAKRHQRFYFFYDSNLDRQSQERVLLQNELRRAIANHELILHYQPKVDINTGQVNSVEALVRWLHPVHGLLYPDTFVPLSEKIGLIRHLTLNVLEMALQQCALWHRHGWNLAISVNISAIDLQDPDFPNQVNEVLKRYPVPASMLELEIVESDIIADPAHAIENITRLNAAGISVSVDDFGTGYSSLVYLKQLPISILKIDKSLIINMADDSNDAAIVHVAIELGHLLGFRVVAEGVESLAILNLLKDLHCDFAQGYYLGKPMATEAFPAWMAESSWGLTQKSG